MPRASSLTIIVVAASWLLSGANPSSAQGPYYAVPAWDQKLPASTRFVAVLSEEFCTPACEQIATAVLDRETGLVWERIPSTSALIFAQATIVCAAKVRGGRAGWRLPDFDEAASLIDPTVTTGLRLPPGHPFINIAARGYWTRTVSPIGTKLRLLVNFDHDLGAIFTPADEAFHRPVWCVRGGAK
jgi:hypothetical protein